MYQGTDDESGANAVEFALVLPILIVLLFGIIYGGLLFNQQLTLTQAAREGARFGATLPVGDSWESSVRARAVNSSSGLVVPAAVSVDLDADVITVRVERQGSLNLVFYEFSPMISATAVARHESEGQDDD